MAVTEFTLPIRGSDHPDSKKHNRRFEVELCVPGEPVELRLEPKNPFDPLAVAIHSVRGVRMGYVPAERCAWIGGRIRNGELIVAAFQGIAEGTGYIRINLAGDRPTLPPARPQDAPAEPIDHDAIDPDYGWPD
jgi:hypothetical protein